MGEKKERAVRVSTPSFIPVSETLDCLGGENGGSSKFQSKTHLNLLDVPRSRQRIFHIRETQDTGHLYRSQSDEGSGLIRPS